MFRADRGIRRVGLAAYAVSALDIGLWDLAGKVAGQPLYRMWGAATDRVEAYGSGGWAKYAVEDILDEAKLLHVAGLPLLQDEDPRPRPARERQARGGRAQGAG